MQKKLALAAAVIHGPRILFLDEPFEGVDALAAGALKALLARMTERGTTIFLTSHVLEIVERLCSHVAIIHKGGWSRRVRWKNCARGFRVRPEARPHWRKFSFRSLARTARNARNSRSFHG